MSGRRLAVRNPRTGLADHAIAPLDPSGIAALAERLREAQPAFEARGADGRAEALVALARSIARHGDAIAAALEADTGRRRVSALEVESVLAMLGRWARLAPGLLAAAEAGGRTAMQTVAWKTSLAPYRLVGVISPWNFPLLLALTDAIPALAAGAAVIVKPSEVAPRFIAPLMDAVAAVPAIADVLAVIEGDGETGAALVDTVDFIAFTGSVATGRRVAEAAARRLIPASLELGGKDPMIVLESADPEAAARIALSAGARATGQACQSIERIYVARPLYAAFRDRLVALAEATRPNVDDIADGDIGPFIHEPQARLVERQLAEAVSQGARIVTGGTIIERGGLWLAPTVVEGVTHAMALMREETFGPVLPLIAFDHVDEAVALANDSRFGLSASVVAGDLTEAEAVGRRLNAGAVSLNDGALTSLVSDAEKSSFGWSGLGPSRMGASGLLRFCRRRALLLQEGPALPLQAFSETGR